PPFLKPKRSNQMSKEQNQTPDEPQLDEKQRLLQQCRTLGIPVSNNSSVETLREKLATFLEQKENAIESEARNLHDGDLAPSELGEYATPSSANLAQVRKRLRDEMLALVRVRIGNPDPKKAALQGEITTYYNDILGQVKHFVQWGDFTENGWHLPRVLVNLLKEREFQHIRTY